MRATNKSASEHSQELSLSELDQVAGGLFDFSGVGTTVNRVISVTQTLGGSGSDGGDGGRGGVDPKQMFQGILQQITQGQA